MKNFAKKLNWKNQVLLVVAATAIAAGIVLSAPTDAHAAYVGQTNTERHDEYTKDSSGNYTVYVPGSEYWTNLVMVNCPHGFNLVLTHSVGTVINGVDHITYYYSVATY